MRFICVFNKREEFIRVQEFYCCHTLLQVLLICFLTVSVQGAVELCHSFAAPSLIHGNQNCSLVCSLKFEYEVTGAQHHSDVALCIKNSSFAVVCNNHVDCRRYHVGAYCKMIPCLCRADHLHHESFIFDNNNIPKIDTCVVPTKQLNTDLPIVPFPWKTLLIVFGILLVFATCLVCLRWLSPVIRSMQAKRSTRANQEQGTLPEDNTSLFPSPPQQNEIPSTAFPYYFPRGIPRIYRAHPRHSQRRAPSSTRVRYTTCAQGEGTLSGTLSNQDKPPPYETAIQPPPPAYEEVERAIRESGVDSFGLDCQRVEVHVVSPRPPPLPANPPPLS